MNKQPRRPAAFTLDDPNVVVAEAEREFDDLRTPPPGTASGSLPVPLPVEQPKPGMRWGALFWSGLGGLITLGVGLAVSRLIEDLFARSMALGWVGTGFAAVAALGLLVIVAREVRSLLQLSAMEDLRERAAATIASDERGEGIAVANRMLHLTRNTPGLARARKYVTAHIDDIIDGADMVRLTERNLLEPLDQEARALVSAAAKRVSIVTAVSPRAMIDMAFVLITALGLMRRLAYLYGARPGTLGLLRLMRLCIAHLTMTGGLALGDGIVQQVFGHGVVAKLSTRLGEGVLNGLLTARLGLAAIEVTRPLPFNALPQPALTDVAAELLRPRGTPT